MCTQNQLKEFSHGREADSVGATYPQILCEDSCSWSVLLRGMRPWAVGRSSEHPSLSASGTKSERVVKGGVGLTWSLDDSVCPGPGLPAAGAALS